MKECIRDRKRGLIMKEEKHTTGAELEFSIFCIENIACRLGVEPVRVYDALTKKSRILNEYIVPEYETLHTQSKAYIVDDVLDIMREQGVNV